VIASRHRFLVVVSLAVALSLEVRVPEAAAQNAARIDTVTPVSGRVGDEVTIEGNGFGAINVHVTVGGIDAQIVAANGHNVTFRVPEGVEPGATEIVAINPGKHIGRAAFTVLPPPFGFTLDSGSAETTLVSTAGGSVTTTASDGVSYTLTIPDGALFKDTAITLTPIAGATGFHLSGGILAAAHLEPQGLQFLQAATLTITLPGPISAALGGQGLLGFVVQNDGTGFEPLPFSTNGSTLTLQVHHFSAAGVGSGVCSPKIVTSSFGIDACREMDEALARLAILLRDDRLGELTQDERDKMAAHLAVHLDRWLFRFVAPSFADAADPTAMDPDVDHFFDVALREFLEIKAIIQLAEQLGVGALMAAPMAQAQGRIPAALRARQAVANARCLADRPLYLTHVGRVLTLANQLDLFGVPVDSETRGVTCVVLLLQVNYPETVPAGGAQMVATADLAFSDGGGLPGPVGPVVRVALDPGFAAAEEPLVSDGEFFSILATNVAPRLDEPNLVTFRVNALSPQVGQRRTRFIERCRIATSNPASSQPPAARQADANTFQQAAVAADEPTCKEEGLVSIRAIGGSAQLKLPCFGCEVVKPLIGSSVTAALTGFNGETGTATLTAEVVTSASGDVQRITFTGSATSHVEPTSLGSAVAGVQGIVRLLLTGGSRLATITSRIQIFRNGAVFNDTSLTEEQIFVEGETSVDAWGLRCFAFSAPSVFSDPILTGDANCSYTIEFEQGPVPIATLRNVGPPITRAYDPVPPA
jgi:IPT/TIG domain-containing protein